MKVEFRKFYILIWSDRLVRIVGSWIGLGKEAYAFAFWPILGIRKSLQHHPVIPELINHEKIHLRQQIELLHIFALLLYIFEFLYARLILRLKKKDAYYWTAAEQEAHRNAMNLNYLKKRKPYAILRYIKDKKKLSRGPVGELIILD